MFVVQLAPTLVSMKRRILNRLLGPILRLPLHSPLDKDPISITYAGSGSGRSFLLVQQVQSGNQLIVIAGKPQSKSLWRDFQSQQKADVIFQGRQVRRSVQVFSEELSRVVPRPTAHSGKSPRQALFLESHAGKKGALGAGELAAARSTDMVVFRLPPRHGRKTADPEGRLLVSFGPDALTRQTSSSFVCKATAWVRR